jgi:hypothetical protein
LFVCQSTPPHPTPTNQHTDGCLGVFQSWASLKR